ncbi:hypothetical protein [Pseudomonas fluorescens]|uniref:hypothetical protein n=1 Tax=Pseudomonas fluorescens TaxID=294 RepID=UPI00209EAA1A|nr:hypothetical protein [Pseudomonas fluorescens]
MSTDDVPMDFQGVTFHPIVRQQAVWSNFPHCGTEHLKGAVARAGTDKTAVLPLSFQRKATRVPSVMLERLDAAKFEVFDFRKKDAYPLNEGFTADNIDSTGSNNEVFGYKARCRLRIFCLPDFTQKLSTISTALSSAIFNASLSKAFDGQSLQFRTQTHKSNGIQKKDEFTMQASEIEIHQLRSLIAAVQTGSFNVATQVDSPFAIGGEPEDHPAGGDTRSACVRAQQSRVDTDP